MQADVPKSLNTPRDHGGGIDGARAVYGGERADWLDLSTGINPVPYPIPPMPKDAWTALPDAGSQDRLIAAARAFWNVPDGAQILAAPGASALIARIPALGWTDRVAIPGPTYNEHAAAFRASGWTVETEGNAPVRVLVHPNNPDGKLWEPTDFGDELTIIDESFCDICPDRSLVDLAGRENVIILKSFGKFWGLAGLRLGFAIGADATMSRLQDMLGPWAVSGPGLHVGALALEDRDWADATRARLQADATQLDDLMQPAGARIIGGTDLFRLYQVDSAAQWQDRLAQNHIWSRIFPYSDRWLRMGLPDPDGWGRLQDALG